MVAEIGVCTARGLARVIGLAEDVLAGEVLDPPDILKEVIHNLREHLMALHARVRGYEDRLKQVAKEDARVRLLRTIPPFGRLLCNRLPGNGTLALSRHRQ
jgi:transposase